MTLQRLLSLLVVGSIISSCSGNKQECTDCAVSDKDSIETPADDMAAALARDTVTAPSKEAKENHEKIVKKYGEQWDFCKCIVANDSITDAFEKKLTTKQEEALMARWEYVDSKCKELTTTPNTTPEERDRHEKRVMKCLKQNGLKK